MSILPCNVRLIAVVFAASLLPLCGARAANP